VLEAAEQAGNGLGSLFLFIGSFSVIAGVLLLVNIFVMLAEERKSELGMLRAVGMKRGRLVRSFLIEGTVYALVAALLGVLIGLGVGRAVVVVAARIFSSFSDETASTWRSGSPRSAWSTASPWASSSPL
jgi:putative ABC transport system permease protein